MDVYRLVIYFFLYGFAGWCLEVAFASVKEKKFVNRGFLNGPICPVYGVGVGAVVTLLEPWKDNLFLLYFASVILVTFIEWLTGYAMDKIFHHKWWDYSGKPLNIGGYVCLLFSLVWGAACVVIVKVIHPLAENLTQIMPFPVGITFCTVFTAALAVDAGVTTAEILKLNRRLDAMGKIAVELHEISDKMGSNIHENVMGAVERLEKFEGRREEFLEKYEGIHSKSEDIREDLRVRREELRRHYEELARVSSTAGSRLMRAFPRMESRWHKDILNDLKERLEKRLRDSKR